MALIKKKEKKRKEKKKRMEEERNVFKMDLTSWSITIRTKERRNENRVICRINEHNRKRQSRRKSASLTKKFTVGCDSR